MKKKKKEKRPVFILLAGISYIQNSLVTYDYKISNYN